MNEGTAWFIYGVVIGLIIGFILMLIVAITVDAEWKQAAISRGYADYSQATGEWQWKKPPKKEGSNEYPK